ncbi:mediator complex, subunit Med5 [Calycina marina]|uniref:Mediator of RNA polymerase II transcription subunit 5 n=1 Tax=Calycina marina TaxID=1763456 RepID=A0A9P7YV30_9HELO|nr:mediator complex, subunit Med5 [Calycina marina]
MPSAPSWTTFVGTSLARRLESDTFSKLVQIQHRKQHLSPSQLCDIFLRPTELNDFSLNVRVRLWLPVLQKLSLINVPAVLRAMKRYSTFGTQADELAGKDGSSGAELGTTSGSNPKRWKDSYYSDEVLFYSMGKYITSGRTPETTQLAVELLIVCIQWMELVYKSGHGVDTLLAPSSKHTVVTNAITALGTLVVGVTESPGIQKILTRGIPPRGTGNRFSRALANFVPLLQRMPAIAERLETFRTKTLIRIEPTDKSTIAASKAIDDILGQDPELGPDSVHVTDLPVMRSRPGLYIYLNALLVGRPLIDDGEIIGYLHNRYQGDMQAMTVDLILAAFDVLADVSARKESNEKEQSKFIARSFLFNKVPLLILNLSNSFFSPLTPEFCIREALAAVDTNIFPTFSSLGVESNYDNMFSDSVRQDFCFACCLHGLLEESSIPALLGDIPMASLPSVRHTKESVLEQCLTDPSKPEAFIDELDNMDGNVGAISQALAALIGKLCRNKDTPSLKSICTKLARNGTHLDAMLIFEKSYTILQPVCEVLDNWHYEEDQGEYQPVYEEFGSVLLLVLAFAHRYDLTTTDLGISSASSFTSKLLTHGPLSKPADSLSELENTQLSGWIRGLFDNERNGLDDELMSTCPPRDFYLLVPTLFHNIVLASLHNSLPEENLKGGLEYLVEPFLLPALVHGITWLSSHLWEARGDANAVLQILTMLISNPPSSSSSTDAGHMFNSVLNIAARNLEHSLRWLQRAEPKRQDIEPLLRALRSNLGFERRGASDHIELESWTKSDSGQGHLVSNFRATIGNLVQWATNPAMNVGPTIYTHRQTLVAIRLLTAKLVLKLIIDEMKRYIELGKGSAVLDVATAMICAPGSASWGELRQPMGEVNIMGVAPLPLQHRTNLREALKIEADVAAKASKEDPFYARLVIRLYRSVEAQMLNLPPPLDILTSDLTGLGTGMGGLPDIGDLSAVSGDMGQGSAMDVLGANNDLMNGLLGGGDLGDPIGGSMDVSDLFGDGMDF